MKEKVFNIIYRLIMNGTLSKEEAYIMLEFYCGKKDSYDLYTPKSDPNPWTITSNGTGDGIGIHPWYGVTSSGNNAYTTAYTATSSVGEASNACKAEATTAVVTE